MNVLGEKVYDKQLQTSPDKNRDKLQTHTIDVSKLAPGIYFCKVTTDQGVAVKKFVKE